MTTSPPAVPFPDHGTSKPLSHRTDDELRDRARELHEKIWVVEIHDDAQVVRPKSDDGDCARIAAWIYLGPDD